MATRKCVVNADGTIEYVVMDAAEEAAFEEERRPHVLTPAEIDAQKDAQIDRLDLVQLYISFNQEKRLRVLEGRPTITIEQFIDALKTLNRERILDG